MRVVMPAGTVQTSGAQIIQTHLMPQAMLKQGKNKFINNLTTFNTVCVGVIAVDASGRTITAARTLAQTSITVTRSPTPNTFVPRGRGFCHFLYINLSIRTYTITLPFCR